ncbi:hypothetical protein FI667_g16073, partial [Globisporangium splendens]
MLTRSRAKAANQPIFVDDQWNDAYIHAKDEQIDAMHALQAHGDWAFATDDESDEDDASGDEDSDKDVWRSDDEANADSTDEEEEEEGDENDEDAVDGVVSDSRLAGGALAENVFWTVMTLLFVPLFLYATVFKRYAAFVIKQVSCGSQMANTCKANAVAAAERESERNDRQSGRESAHDRRLAARVLRRRVLHERVDFNDPNGISNNDSVAAQRGAALAQPGAPRRRRLQRVVRHWLDAVPGVQHARRRQHLAVVRAVAGAGDAIRAAGCGALLLSPPVAQAAVAEKRAAIQIFSLDPTFAFANESIFVSIDGQNLAQGGIIAWVPYWGGVQQMKAHKCPKLFPRPLDNGGVLVTFDAVNEFIPCYCTAADAAKSSAEHPPAFRCFEDIKLRVKDQKSVPGWSLHASNDEL